VHRYPADGGTHPHRQLRCRARVGAKVPMPMPMHACVHACMHPVRTRRAVLTAACRWRTRRPALASGTVSRTSGSRSTAWSAAPPPPGRRRQKRRHPRPATPKRRHPRPATPQPPMPARHRSRVAAARPISCSSRLLAGDAVGGDTTATAARAPGRKPAERHSCGQLSFVSSDTAAHTAKLRTPAGHARRS